MSGRRLIWRIAVAIIVFTLLLSAVPNPTDSINLQQQARNVELVGQINTPGSAWDVAVVGDYAYVADWHIETVDQLGKQWEHTSLALDGNGYPHISYYSGADGDLTYAYQSASGWHIETIDTGLSSWDWGYTSLALDEDGHPRIAYYDNTNALLKYAYKDGSGWHIEIAVSGWYVGTGVSLTLDEDGYPHVSYQHYGINYAYEDSSGWHTEYVVFEGFAGGSTSLALDSSGRPHISYQDYADGDFPLRYARRDDSGWHIETVTTDGAASGHWPESLALDGGGYPHIIYADYSIGLQYAYQDASGWHIETVPDGPGGLSGALALDKNGYPRIASSSEYIYKDASGWHTEATGCGCLLGNSLALDISEQPHFSCIDLTDNELKYAYRSAFRPNPDGYRFSNRDPEWGKYPDPPANKDFTISDMRRMFGDEAVCYTMIGPFCPFKWSAFRWYLYANLIMNSGHCDGMAATGLRFFDGTDNPADFQSGANTTYDLWLSNARRNIAYYQVLQFTVPMQAYIEQAETEQTPSDALARLVELMLNGDLLVLHISQGNAGHTLTPYAIEDWGNGVYWVWVYDSNHRNDASRHVIISMTSEGSTWSYDMDVGVTWSGDASTHSLHVLPISRYSEKPTSWQDIEGIGIWLIGQGHLLITDSQGRRIGYVGDQFVSEIPGAYESIIFAGPNAGMEPIYTVPLTDTYTILIDGQTITQTETVEVTQFGPGYAVSVEDVTLEPNSQDELIIAQDGTQLTYQPGNNDEVSLTLALDGETEGHQFQIKGADIGAGQIATLAADNGQLVFNNAQTSGGEYDLEIKRASAVGEQKFAHYSVAISATDTHYVDHGAWDGSGSMTLQIDHGSDGTIDETVELKNQKFRIYLPFIIKNYP